MKSVSISRHAASELLEKISGAKIGLLGDACLDFYWEADMRRSRISLETPKYPLPVVRERAYPGGAGNVANCVATIGAREVRLITLIGKDWRSAMLLDLLKSLGINTDGIILSPSRVTPGYCKVLQKGISDVVYEDPRIDFENYSSPSASEEEAVLEALDEVAKQVDVLIVEDQFLYGCVTDRVRARLAELSSLLPVIVDSRDRGSQFENVILKPNELEAAVHLGMSPEPKTIERFEAIARKISLRMNKPVIVTLGDAGSLWLDRADGEIVHAHPQKILPPFDIVGAGDAFLSAFACAMAAGANGGESAALGNIAASIAIKKIGVTGTASPKEILGAAQP
ncbi:MAG: PfkB family carbohydrate kinase [Clostridiales bacterium]|jgi:rfaE bifunctional protein kinase chain/domain|nr:PfkB family carbohydrate kinase [Clostridiales bacterium]